MRRDPTPLADEPPAEPYSLTVGPGGDISSASVVSEYEDRRGFGVVVAGKDPSDTSDPSSALPHPDATVESLTAEEAFEQVFWPEYPRKTKKVDARKAWRQIGLEDDDQETLDHIMRGLHHWIRTEWARNIGNPDRIHYIDYPATWLRARAWEDVE